MSVRMATEMESSHFDYASGSVGDVEDAGAGSELEPSCTLSTPNSGSVSHSELKGQHQSPEAAEIVFPNLTRKVVLTYRGRQLREEIVEGTARYIDDAAIFISHLDKEKETELTLLKRFERYGRVVSVAR